MHSKEKIPYVIGCRIAVCLLAIVWLTSCMFNPLEPTDETIDVGDGGFLSGEPCGPPCFWGIVPGQTTEAQVIEILKSKGVLTVCDFFNNEAEGGSRGMKCGSRIFISFRQDSEVIDGIGYDPSVSITAKDVISKYGKPDGVLIIPDGIPEDPYTMFVIVYSRISTHLRLPRQRGLSYYLEPSTPIENIAYGVEYGISIDNHIFYEEWRGYGEY